MLVSREEEQTAYLVSLYLSSTRRDTQHRTHISVKASDCFFLLLVCRCCTSNNSSYFVGHFFLGYAAGDRSKECGMNGKKKNKLNILSLHRKIVVLFLFFLLHWIYVPCFVP